MVKPQTKPQGIKRISQNNLNKTLKLDSELSKNQAEKEYKPAPKTRQQIYQENYQKNKERKKQQRRERYQQQRLQAQQTNNEQLSKYYTAESIKVFMSLKEYTELNPSKRKIWLNFVWILKELAGEGMSVNNIVDVMKLREEADKLIHDYDKTAKAEVKKRKHSWDTLEPEQKDRLIKYWGYEKVRIENNYIEEEERLEKQSREYLKAIELAKYHEERGKIKCPCYSCETKKEIQKEVKAKMKRELEEHDDNDKEQSRM